MAWLTKGIGRSGVVGASSRSVSGVIEICRNPVASRCAGGLPVPRAFRPWNVA